LLRGAADDDIDAAGLPLLDLKEGPVLCHESLDGLEPPILAHDLLGVLGAGQIDLMPVDLEGGIRIVEVEADLGIHGRSMSPMSGPQMGEELGDFLRGLPVKGGEVLAPALRGVEECGEAFHGLGGGDGRRVGLET